jgi:hypothetical protein
MNTCINYAAFIANKESKLCYKNKSDLVNGYHELDLNIHHMHIITFFVQIFQRISKDIKTVITVMTCLLYIRVTKLLTRRLSANLQWARCWEL